MCETERQSSELMERRRRASVHVTGRTSPVRTPSPRTLVRTPSSRTLVRTQSHDTTACQRRHTIAPLTSSGSVPASTSTKQRRRVSLQQTTPPVLTKSSSRRELKTAENDTRSVRRVSISVHWSHVSE